jgi:hypothetical protein
MNQVKLGTGVTPVTPAAQEIEIRRTTVQGQFSRPYLENTNTKKSWQSSSSSRAPA